MAHSEPNNAPEPHLELIARNFQVHDCCSRTQPRSPSRVATVRRETWARAAVMEAPGGRPLFCVSHFSQASQHFGALIIGR